MDATGVSRPALDTNRYGFIFFFFCCFIILFMNAHFAVNKTAVLVAGCRSGTASLSPIDLRVASGPYLPHVVSIRCGDFRDESLGEL